MIRLPATSISLSENDVRYHLRHIEIYHGLLAQGFKKQDIIRYYAEQRASITGTAVASQAPTDDGGRTSPIQHTPSPEAGPKDVGGIAPTCVELRSSAPIESLLRCNEQGTTHTDGTTGLRTSPHVRDKELSPPGLFTDEGVIIKGNDLSTLFSLKEAGQSPPVLSQASVTSRHAPRQSSLLRFTKNISPETSRHFEDSSATTDSEVYHTSLENTDFITLPHTRARTYRPRSRTYPFVESDADDSGQPAAPIQSIEIELSALTLEDSSQGITSNTIPFGSGTRGTLPLPGPTEAPVATIQPTTSPLRPEADVFIPFSLPPPFSATRRVSSSQHSLPSSIHSFTADCITSTHEHLSRSFPPIPTPPRRSSLSATTWSNLPQSSSPAGDYPSSPPRLSDQRRSSPSYSPPAFVTPSIRSAHQPITEPRNSSGRQYDGNSFSVYNDKVPAYRQPQTPADLSRTRLITEHEVAYTAPPGMVSRNTFTASQHHRRTTLDEPGEQSPTIRAMDIRQRRNRETMRSFRVEGSRWSRMRRVDTEGGGFMHLNTNSPGYGLTDAWRDELDADRVGEENFEDERGLRMDARMFEEGQRGRRTPRRSQ